MKEGRSSFTARVVAFGRGVGVSEDDRDDLVMDLIGGPLGGTLRRINKTAIVRRVCRPLLRAGTFGLVDHSSLRMLSIDRRVSEAKFDQLVILGAGLDDRAWRLPSLSRTPVFEVDHPSSQAEKRSRATTMKPRGPHSFVPVDFAEDDLGAALEEAGHDATKRTFWIWEGVTMYLSPEATDHTLGIIGERSYAGSTLVMSYVTRELQDGWIPTALVQRAFSGIGEPLIGAMSQHQAQTRLLRVGFEVQRDENSVDWAKESKRTSLLAAPVRLERLITGVRT